MKKILLMLAIALFFVGSSASAEVAGEGKVVEIKDKTTKTFMYQILSRPYIHHIASNFYHKKYNAKSIGWGEVKSENIRIWIQEAKPAQGEASYTHIVKIYIPYEKIVINDKKEINTADTYVFAIDGDMFSLCSESGKTENQVKLLKHHHKEQR
ncbi:hypothetical protein [Neobacillus soli]|uniref:hypothetical protein n=1 Tax=Neobacillus soli TaxID=220688 RepID=UPI0008270CEA|nr:hypothetical protein [Neobacillus soli]